MELNEETEETESTSADTNYMTLLKGLFRQSAADYKAIAEKALAKGMKEVTDLIKEGREADAFYIAIPNKHSVSTQRYMAQYITKKLQRQGFTVYAGGKNVIGEELLQISGWSKLEDEEENLPKYDVKVVDGR